MEIRRGYGETDPHRTDLQSSSRKFYIRPAIRRELKLETSALGSSPAVSDPGLVDPDLPGKPVGGSSGLGGTDPALPAKPLARPGSSGGSSGRSDPALPPKPPTP